MAVGDVLGFATAALGLGLGCAFDGNVGVGVDAANVAAGRVPRSATASARDLTQFENQARMLWKEAEPAVPTVSTGAGDGG
jgi:hypothetical protein